MYPYFVRVYKLTDGSVIDINAVYQDYQTAESDLPLYKGVRAGDIKTLGDVVVPVEYGKIEKRYSPTPIFVSDSAPPSLPSDGTGSASCNGDQMLQYTETPLNPGDPIIYTDAAGQKHNAKADTVWSPTCINLTCDDGYQAPTSVPARVEGMTGNYFERAPA